MNTANLQLEGLYIVLAEIIEALVEKGVLTRDEVDFALRRAEHAATGENRSVEDLSPAHRDAVAFPARLLQLANRKAHDDRGYSFYDLAREVGQTKQPYNDQR